MCESYYAKHTVPNQFVTDTVCINASLSRQSRIDTK